LATAAGQVALYEVGPLHHRQAPGVPLVLVHSVNAAASAAEVRPIAEQFAAHCPVFALELPGFGSSAREDRRYTPQAMARAILDALRHIRARGYGPVNLLAVSLSCEFAALAALEAPCDIARLAFVSPTGVGKRLTGPYRPGATREIGWLTRAIKGRRWSKSLFKLLTKPATIRFFLNKTWGSKAIDEALLEYCVLSTQVEGAEHAPLSFVSAALFTPGIHQMYEKLTCPVWVAHGTRGDFTDYGGIPSLQTQKPWRVVVYEAGALCYFEHPQKFAQDLQSFLTA
jgi:pimeloyl-ACP methyl ester carboxylesterase